jgi:hypothetical protein
LVGELREQQSRHRSRVGDNAEADERGHGELRVLESTGSKQAIGASQVGVC